MPRPPTGTAILLLLLALGCEQPQPGPLETPSPERTPIAALGPAPVPALQWHRSEVRRGESLDWVLRRLEVPPTERGRVVELLGREVDLRHILPGETVEVGRSTDGALREVALVRDAELTIRARLPSDGEAAVAREEKRPEIWVRSLRGELDGSLYEAFLAAGADPNLTMRFADLLSWEVDFLTEPRAGDRFRVLVQEERLSDQPPRFGKILAAEYVGVEADARAIRYVDGEGALDWYDDRGESVRRAFLRSPLNYRRISSGFTSRRRHPVLKRVMPHYGIDYAAKQGTPVSALGDGVVSFRGRKGGFGNYLEIRHNGTYTTCYGHLAGFARGLRKGSRVRQGDVVGYVGSTGLSTGPHLDFRVRRNGQYVNPLRLDSPPGRSLDAEEMSRFARHRDRTWRLTELVGEGEAVPEEIAWSRVSPGTGRSYLLAIMP